jgi:hypothetical protein
MTDILRARRHRKIWGRVDLLNQDVESDLQQTKRSCSEYYAKIYFCTESGQHKFPRGIQLNVCVEVCVAREPHRIMSSSEEIR